MEVSPSLYFDGPGVRRVVVPNSILEELEQECRWECIAILLGTRVGGEYRVQEARRIEGTYVHGVFKINFRDWAGAIQGARLKGLEYIGLIHFHANSPPVPSPLDARRMAECPGEVWVIKSKTGVRAWVYESELRELELVVT
ncbi:Mov34/MPN/PAD-1 family protein [Infirmifilum lucidum]|uniref:Mov34/MPN/PAD-1 family protein n=1 Tax=Infirmifilum lucidum TaxID=2776706 RepID=A0A7L9FHP7_9CREN|nr:Mov34/MPN/PAD-1 family protein [Infirmifilum lucidum]QOJ78436.1 Mov34/MPN/PAD-1 family protein [Infirmifilum lucidum]